MTKQKLYVAVAGFDKDFSDHELRQMLLRHVPTLRPHIRNENAYSDSRVSFEMEYQARSSLLCEQ